MATGLLFRRGAPEDLSVTDNPAWDEIYWTVIDLLVYVGRNSSPGAGGE